MDVGSDPWFKLVPLRCSSEAVVFQRRPPVPAMSRWTTCVKTARVLLQLGCDRMICIELGWVGMAWRQELRAKSLEPIILVNQNRSGVKSLFFGLDSKRRFLIVAYLICLFYDDI